MAQGRNSTIRASAKVVATICNGVPEVGWDIVERIRDDQPTLQFFRRQDQDQVYKWADPGMKSISDILGFLSPEAMKGMKVSITKHPESPRPNCTEIEFGSVEEFLKSGYDLRLRKSSPKGRTRLVLVEP